MSKDYLIKSCYELRVAKYKGFYKAISVNNVNYKVIHIIHTANVYVVNVMSTLGMNLIGFAERYGHYGTGRNFSG
jgi:hypothetical protein